VIGIIGVITVSGLEADVTEEDLEDIGGTPDDTVINEPEDETAPDDERLVDDVVE
jgi:hypothetical protein